MSEFKISYNNNNMKNIKSLIIKNNIPYNIVVVGVDKKTNKKIVVGRKDKIIKENDEKLEKLIHNISEKDISSYSICYELNIKQTPICVIDFDDYNIKLEDIYKLYPTLENCYYTTGNTKGFHFYVSNADTINMGTHTKVLTNTEGDFIKENIWESIDKTLYGDTLVKVDDFKIFYKDYPFKTVKETPNNNSTSNIPTLILNTEIENVDELREIVDNIPSKYSDSYSDWIKIISILKKYNQYEMALNFSKKSKKFNECEFNDWYNNKTINCDALSIGTVFEYSKNSKTNFTKIKNKYKKLLDKKKQLELLDQITTNNSNEFEIMKSDFEKTHFKIINKNYIKVCENSNIIFLTRREITDMYCHLKYFGYDDKGNYKKISFIDKWITCEDILSFEDCDFYPDPKSCSATHYNLWKNFAIENYESKVNNEEDLNFILQHIRLICGNDDAVYEYMLDWFAHIFVYPEQKIGIFPILQGDTGTGKSLILNLIKNMIGSNKCGFTNNAKDQVFGSFNPILSGKIFIEIAELDFLATKGLEGKFKSLITDEQITINNKGVKERSEQSYHRFIATTNDDIPIKISKNDRRILLIEGCNSKKGDVEYFEKLDTLIKSKDLQKQFYNFLISRDTIFKSPAEACKRMPQTKVQQDLMEYFTAPEESFFEDLVNRRYSDKLNTITISVKTLFLEYKDFCENTGIEAMTQKKLCYKLIKKYNSCISKRKSSTIIYHIDVTNEIIVKLLNNTNKIMED